MTCGLPNIKERWNMDERFAEFSRKDFESRYNRLKKEMHINKTDILVLTDTNNIRWASGYWNSIMDIMPTAVIIPLSDNRGPVLYMNSDATGMDLTWIEDVRFWEEKKGSQPYDGGHIPDVGKIMARCVTELGGEDARIGLELSGGMKLNLDQGDIDIFRETLTTAEFVDFSPSLWRLRSIKSGEEIEKIRRACSITAETLKESFLLLKPGVTERQFSQIIQSRWFQKGATGSDYVSVGFGKYSVKYGHYIPRDVPLERGDLVKVDLGCSYEGYRADMYRLACAGKATDLEEKISSAVKKANQAAVRIIREGVKCSELFDAAARVLEDEGFLGILGSTSIGHGMGLDIHEWPFILKGDDTELRPNMVIAVEPWVLDFSDWSHVVNIEDNILVTEEGHEVLTDMDRDIFRLDVN